MAVGGCSSGEQPQHAGIAPAFDPPRFDDVVGDDLEPALAHGLLVAFEPLGAGVVAQVAGEDRNARMPDVEEVADGAGDAARFSTSTRSTGRPGHVVVVEDDRRTARDQLPDALARLLVAVHDQAVDAVGREEIERLDDRSAIVVVAIGQQAAPGSPHAAG